MVEKRGYGSFEVSREGSDTVLRVDFSSAPFFPSIEDSSYCMGKVVDELAKNRAITRVVFYQKSDYEYDYEQVQVLAEIARLYSRLTREPGLDAKSLSGTRSYADVKAVIYNLLRSDPVGAFVELHRMLRSARILAEKVVDKARLADLQQHIAVLERLVSALEATRLIVLAKPYIAGYVRGDRSAYRQVFQPSVKPDFMFTKLMASFPTDGEEVAAYDVGNTDVSIFRMPDSVQYLYHVNPAEFKLSEDRYELLDSARRILSEHKPQRQEFVDPERMRQVFFNVGHDLIEELADNNNVKLRASEVEELASILVRYTVGFGLIEVLLEDKRIQDITINSPMGRLPIFVVHEEFSNCFTNIMPTATEGESWASKLRMISGRPLDEANPVLDTDLVIPGARARVAVISPPINPTGLAYAFRRHRDKPWTLPLFIKNRMINPLSAGLMSFLVDGSRAILIAGTRSAGKTSFLGALMTEIMRKNRIVTIEDTLELPTDALRNSGYNIQSMKVASAMTRGTMEVSADEGIRTTLRMGDSCLIVGEVRSLEARALYEAMRVGAMANVVAGTIHGDSPYGVFDRVVNDLGVPRTSFKATDVIIVANPIKSADGLHSWRRVTQLTEVGKFWEDDPLREQGFKDLLKYEPGTDQLEPTPGLINGDSDVLKAVAGNVKEWAGNWDALWDNVLLRSKVKEVLVDYSDKIGMPELLEADFVINANDEFHRSCERVREDTGFIDSKRVFFEWEDWLKRSIKKMKLR